MTQSERKVNEIKKPKVAIIGAGYTGLTIAYYLVQHGCDVTIFEKEDFVGGLASSFELDGLSMEKIWHFLYLSDDKALELAERLGIKDKLVFHDSTVSTYYDGKLYPFMSPVDLLKFKPLSFLNRIRTGLVAVYLKKIKNWEPLTKITAYEWLKKYAGKQATEVIWKPLLKGKFAKYYDKVLMSWLWGRIKVRIDSQEDSGEKLGYFQGGFGLLTDRLVEEIEKGGGKIKTGFKIDKILTEKNKVAVSYLSTNSVDEHSVSEKKFDKVVVTTPSSVFADLIKDNDSVNPLYLKKLKSIQYVGAVVMVFSSSQKISPYYWHNINDEDMPFLVFLANSELAGKETYDGKNIYYIGFYAEHEHKYFKEDPEKIMSEWLSALKKIFSDFDEKQITDKRLFKFKNAQHIVDMNYRAKIPAHKTPLQNIYLSNFSQIYPEDRGLNFAIRDGEKIANMIIKEI